MWLLGASILPELRAFSSSRSVSSELLPARPAVSHCVYCLGRNFSFGYQMIHRLAVILADVMCPAPTPTELTQILYFAYIYFVSFVVKRVAANLSCGKQVWSTTTRFSGFPSPRPSCVYTHRVQPCLSCLSWDLITLYPLSAPSLPQLITRTLLLIQALRAFSTSLQSCL